MDVSTVFEERYWYPDDGGIVWLAGFVPVDPETGRFLSRDALREQGVIVTGAPGTFCAGTDLSDLETVPGKERGTRGAATLLKSNVKVDGETITLDGNLDEAVWTRAIPAADFIQIDPANGTATFTYTVTARAGATAESGWAMSGSATVNNPNAYAAITADVVVATDLGGSVVTLGIAVVAGGVLAYRRRWVRRAARSRRAPRGWPR